MNIYKSPNILKESSNIIGSDPVSKNEIILIYYYKILKKLKAISIH